MKLDRQFVIWLVVSLFVTLSCSGVSLTPPEDEGVLVEATSHVQVQSATPIPATPTPTATIHLSPTLTPSLTPTVDVQELETLFLTNGGCEFPCWLGVRIGETSWEEVRKVFEPLAFRISKPEDILNRDWAEITFWLPDDFMGGGFIRQSYVLENGTIFQLESLIPSNTFFNPRQFLTTYGPPDEIYLYVRLDPPLDDLVVGSYHYYESLGFFLSFTVDVTLGDQGVTFCLRDKPSDMLSIWELGNEFTFFDRVRRSHLLGFSRDHVESILKPLQSLINSPQTDASNPTVDFINGRCFESSREKWIIYD